MRDAWKARREERLERLFGCAPPIPPEGLGGDGALVGGGLGRRLIELARRAAAVHMRMEQDEGVRVEERLALLEGEL